MTNTLHSINEYDYTGQSNFVAPSHQQASDIVVLVNDVVKTQGTDYTLTGSLVTFTGFTPSNGDKISIRRETASAARQVDFTSGSMLKAETLDQDSNQIFFMAQEALDKAEKIGGEYNAKYFGSSAVAPQEASVGDLWFDLNAQTMKVYQPNGWQVISSSVANAVNRVSVTATSGQTTFPFNYDVGALDVYLNGVKLFGRHVPSGQIDSNGNVTATIKLQGTGTYGVTGASAVRINASLWNFSEGTSHTVTSSTQGVATQDSNGDWVWTGQIPVGTSFEYYWIQTNQGSTTAETFSGGNCDPQHIVSDLSARKYVPDAATDTFGLCVVNGTSTAVDYDFVAANGTSVVLSTAASAGDVVELISTSTSPLNSVVTGAEGTDASFDPNTGVLTIPRGDSADDEALYYNGALTLNTRSDGISVTGRKLEVTGANPIFYLFDNTNTNTCSIQNTDGHFLYRADSGNEVGGSKHTFQIDGNDVMRLDTTGLGVGTTLPASKLHVRGSNSGATGVADGTLIVEQGSAPSIQILSANTQTQSIKFGDAQDGDVGKISYSHADNHMGLFTDGTEAVRIDSAGNVGVNNFNPAEALDVVGNIAVTGTVDGVDIATLATETYVDTAVSGLVDSAPATLDTLNELASALGDDANFSTTVSNNIGTKWTEDATKISNWDTAYSWGNHADANYLAADADDTTTGKITADGGFETTVGNILTNAGNISTTLGNVSGSAIYGSTFTCFGDITVNGTVDGVDIAALNTTVSGKADLSGATFTGNVSIGLPPSGTESLTVAGTTNLHGGVTGGLDVTGDITVTGTVDGVDIATRDAVLATTTTTANSAMQDLVDDTTPQLGGDLDLNSKTISGTGNLYINQPSTSTPAVHLISGDGSDVASPTIRLERFSSTTADDDNIGKIEFYGATEEYANITGVIDDATSTTIDGQIDFNVARDDTLTTVMSVKSTEIELPNGTNLNCNGEVFSTGGYGTNSGDIVTTNGNILTTNGNITAGGNVVVAGTVDGRDIAADGAALDAIPYHKIRHYKISADIPPQPALTTTNVDLGYIQTYTHDSTPVAAARYVDVDFVTQWTYSSSATNDVLLSLYLTVPSGVTITSLGTLTHVSTGTQYQTRGSGETWYYVSGDHTHLFSEFSKVSPYSTGVSNTGTAIQADVRAYNYDAATNRTYICLYNGFYTSSNFSTGDTLYFHPYSFETAGTEIFRLKRMGEKYATAYERQNFRFKLGYTDDALSFKLKVREETTNDNASVRDASVRLTSMGL